jgi:hypothetical protein
MGVLIAAAAMASAHAGNLLQNHSLESGTSNTDATFWTLHAGDTFREDTNSFGFTAAAMHDGFYGVKQFGGDGDISQANIPVYPNTDYDLSGWFYHSSTEDVIANSTISTRMFMHVEWFDINNVSLRNDYTANHNGTSPADVWVPIHATFNSPAGSHHATFHVESDSDVGGGSVFGDNFQFIPEPATIGLIACGAAMLGGLRRRNANGQA